jgi:hypothetical protein
MSSPASRIPPVTAEGMTEDQRALLGAPPPGATGGWEGDLSSMNFAAVLAQHPGLYTTLLPLISKLIPGSDLPPRDREILLLRTLSLCHETYEARHNVVIARNAGMSEAEIEAARKWNRWSFAVRRLPCPRCRGARAGAVRERRNLAGLS